MQYFALMLIKGYQLTLGRILPRVCRYEPTCSSYSHQAIVRFGIVRGVLLSAWRIIRCNPFLPGGFDPVPRQFGGHLCAKNK
jgi:putative membrane protein insertion efficiency factor